MPRPFLPPERVAPRALVAVEGFHAETVREVEQTVGAHDVVVVGMAQNPFVKRARRALDAAGVAYRYLEYGSYLGEWRRRLAIKMWSGWPTFPQVFVKGTLIGGAAELERALADGSLKETLSA